MNTLDTLTLDTITTMLADGWRPPRGKCFIHLDAPPTMAGLLHIPERSQEVQLTDAVWRGLVLAMNPRPYDVDNPLIDPNFPTLAWKGGNREEFAVGDSVLLLLRAEDMDRTVVITDNTRIVAVIGE